MGNSSAGTRGGGIKEHTARTSSSRVETSAAGAGTGDAGTTAEGPRPGGESKRQRGRSPRAEGGDPGQSRPPRGEGARPRGKAVFPHPAHPRCRQQLGKGRRKKSQQGRGSRRNTQQVPPAAPQETAGLGQESKAGAAASWPLSLSLTLSRPLPHRTHSATRRS